MVDGSKRHMNGRKVSIRQGRMTDEEQWLNKLYGITPSGHDALLNIPYAINGMSNEEYKKVVLSVVSPCDV